MLFPLNTWQSNRVLLNVVSENSLNAGFTLYKFEFSLDEYKLYLNALITMDISILIKFLVPELIPNQKN